MYRQNLAERRVRSQAPLRPLDRPHRALDEIVDADEISHETGGGPLVERLGRPHLADFSEAEDRDAIRHRQRFFLVVRHVDRGDAELLLELADLRPHLHADLGVEIGERLVEQQHLRIQHERTRQRHALLLPARQLAGITIAQPGETHLLQHRSHPPGPVGRGDLAQLQAVRDVLGHRHVRPQRIVLEHHADAALVRRHVVDHAIAETDLARVRRVETGQEPQQRGLAAARRTEEGEHLALLDRQADVVDRRQRPEALREIVDRDAHECRVGGRRFSISSSGLPRRTRYPCETAS